MTRLWDDSARSSNHFATFEEFPSMLLLLLLLLLLVVKPKRMAKSSICTTKPFRHVRFFLPRMITTHRCLLLIQRSKLQAPCTFCTGLWSNVSSLLEGQDWHKIDSVCLRDLHLVSAEGHEVPLSMASCIYIVATSNTFHKADYTSYWEMWLDSNAENELDFCVELAAL